MKTFPRFSLTLGLLLGLSGVRLLAQAASPGPVSFNGDPLWEQVRQFERETAGKSSKSSNDDNAAPQQVSKADELRDFRQRNANDARNHEARRLEALLLLRANLLGDTSIAARCDDLVGQVRSDASLAPAARYAVVVMADMREPATGKFKTEQARLDRFEEIIRGHIRDFPTLPDPYEALVHLADDSPDASLARLADDLVNMPGVPAEFKAAAKALQARHALQGQNLSALLASAMPTVERPALPKNKVVILYAWASWNPGGSISGTEIATGAPADATIIGVNFDTDVAAAKKLAKEQKLPGVQLYDPAGLAGKLPQALCLTGKAVVYVTDREGNIRTVAARRNLGEELQLAKN